MRIFTLGTAEITEAEFSKILTKCQIQVVADIRLSSSRHPESLKREDIQRVCSDNRVEYLYLGNELGSEEGGGRISAVDPDLYKRGISILQSLARTRGLLILGSTCSPERCIRRKIASELSKEGAEVVHLLNLETTWKPGAARPRGKPARRDHGKGKYRSDKPDSRHKKGRPPLKKKTRRSKMDKIS